MATVLDHTILNVADMGKAVAFYTDVMGFAHEGPFSRFEVIRVNDDLTIDLAEGKLGRYMHLAFAMDRETFDATFARIRESGMPYGDGPGRRTNMKGPGRTGGSRGEADAVYMDDPSGHIIEIRVY